MPNMYGQIRACMHNECTNMHTYAHVCTRMHRYAHICTNMLHTYAHARTSWRICCGWAGGSGNTSTCSVRAGYLTPPHPCSLLIYTLPPAKTPAISPEWHAPRPALQQVLLWCPGPLGPKLLQIHLTIISTWPKSGPDPPHDQVHLAQM